MITPLYSLDEIKISIDKNTWFRAVKLYRENRVKNFKTQDFGFTALVQGTYLYTVSVNHKNFDVGYCDCYLGQRDILCKHMIAVAIYSLKQGKSLTKEEEQFTDHFEFALHPNLDINNPEQFLILKSQVRTAFKYIRAYTGPSRIWSQYQDNLAKGCAKLRLVLSNLSLNLKTVHFILNILLRLDKKLSYGGVDDSNGIVGGFIEQVVSALSDISSSHREIIQAFKKLLNQRTNFGWEKQLVNIYNEHKHKNEA